MIDITEYGAAQITLDEDGRWNLYYSELFKDGSMGEGHSVTMCLDDLLIVLKHKLIVNREQYASRIEEINESK